LGLIVNYLKYLNSRNLQTALLINKAQICFRTAFKTIINSLNRSQPSFEKTLVGMAIQ